MTFDFIKPTLDSVDRKFSPNQMMFCITGGEPLLNSDWEKICTYIYELGFCWGMTSNGTLIDKEMVFKIKICRDEDY